MTALDRAFIKAYQQQGAAPISTPLDSARSSVPLSDALPVGIVDTDSSTTVEPVTEASIDVSLRESLDTIANDTIANDIPPIELDLASWRASDEEAVQTQPAATEQVADTPSFESLGFVSPPAPELESELTQSKEPGSIVNVTSESTSKPECLRPFLQVDNFNWPPICSELLGTAGTQIDQLVDVFVDNLASGHKVMALSGCQRGEGCTTLLLSVAKRLTARNLKTVIVDADLRTPGLAQRLGVCAAAGWEAVMLGRLPLAEVLIESTNDHLTILPLCGTENWQAEITTDGTSLNSILQQLRKHYDIVLVDLGVPDHVQQSATDPPQASGNGVDAAILVRNVRTSPELHAEAIQGRLEVAGIEQVGIAENFAAA